MQPPSGQVVWITGLSASGKSTLAAALTTRLREQGEHVVMLDGDELRQVLAAEGKRHHDRQTRLDLAFRYARLCKLLADQGIVVVIATICLFKEIHEWNRKNLPGYLEVFMDLPPEVLRQRDPKGIYARFDAGEIQNVAGLDLLVDAPENPDLHITRESLPNHHYIDQITDLLKRMP